MSNYVRISTVAPRALREKPEVNQAAVDHMIAFWREELDQVLPDQPDLIVVPEACDRYPALPVEERRAYYRLRGDQVLRFFADTAKEHDCYIAYSAARELPDGTWRNSTQIIGRDGVVVGIYNKNHCTIGETNEGGILCGREAPVFECDFGRVACAICFDLNFDELRLQYVESKPDLILFSSMYHGGLMQSYWAYSCRAHMVTSVCGAPSGMISPMGDVLAMSTNYYDFVSTTVNLDCKVVHLDYNHEKLAAMRKKYGPKVSVYDPGYIGAVLMASETDEITSDDLLQEFGIELWDDYYARALAHRHDPKNMEPA
jgi:predicted amidohydrolase